MEFFELPHIFKILLKQKNGLVSSTWGKGFW
jgi:hypothetical protein